MIRYTEGNLLDAPVEALVNTVNTVGVMGKGIALQFSDKFKKNLRAYRVASERGDVRVGRMFVTETDLPTGPRWIVNFPTKKHWRQPSKLEYVETGLQDLARVIRELRIRSIAVPPLGCGNGGLDWDVVRAAIESALGDLPDVDVVVYQPTAVYTAAPKSAGIVRLTVARAMLVDLVRRYLVLGFECTNLEVQKLAYLLQRVVVGQGLPDELKLAFKAHKYGPYADALRHLLDKLDGSYLHSEKRVADAGPFDVIRLDTGRLASVDEYLARQPGVRYASALDAVDEIIDGFQSPYLMELLTTVDWIMRERAGNADTDAVFCDIQHWPGGEAAARRKARLFDRDSVELAHARLARYAKVLYPASDN